MKARGRTAQIEGGAFDELPAKRAPDDGPQVLARNLIGCEAVDAQAHDPARSAAGRNTKVANLAAAESTGAERPRQVGNGQLRGPCGLSFTGLVVLRRQKFRIHGAWPDSRRPFRMAAAR